MTVPFMYNFRRFSNKIPTTLPRRFLGDFICVFDPVLFLHFCFRGLIRSERKKMNSSKGIITLWSTLSFFLFGDKNLIYFVVTAFSHDSFGRN